MTGPVLAALLAVTPALALEPVAFAAATATVQSSGSSRGFVLEAELPPSALPGPEGGSGAGPLLVPLQPIPVQLNGRCLGFVAVAVPRVPALLRAGDASLPIRDVRLVQADGAPAEGSLALSQVGKRDLRVEATLVVASNQPRRTYRGQIDLTMTYN